VGVLGEACEEDATKGPTIESLFISIKTFKL